MSVIIPTQNQILKFLREFRASGLEKTYDVDQQPYSNNQEKTFLLAFCLKNDYIEEFSRNRFRDLSISYLGEGLLLAGKSPLKRAQLWIEDHPSLWGLICGAVGYFFPFIHEMVKRVL
ncbi:hypothetical protein M0P65_03970 [Candidatus Gracilibacteria bacterium]|nr:hypothetical protein [Candidatus Gracilibacteria bacterium]